MLRLSKGKRATGSIKQLPEDFKVEEITQNGTILKLDTKYSARRSLGVEAKEGEFTVFVMQKTTGTPPMLSSPWRRCTQQGHQIGGICRHKGQNRAVDPALQHIRSHARADEGDKDKGRKDKRGMEIDSKIELGMLAGNHFTITVRNVKNRNR
jgi:tRNA(Glu) U13 pseudouridine synthase TruD